MRKKILLICVPVLLLSLFAWVLFKPLGGPDRVPVRLIDFLGTAAEIPAEFSTSLRIAAAAFEASPEKENNIAEMERIALLAKADHPDLRILVFGEASLGLYHNPEHPVDYQRQVAEPIPGPTSERLGALARRSGVYLAYGAIECEGDTLYNSLAVVNPEGRVLARHRKMLLHNVDVLGGIAESPPNSQVVEIEGLKFGLAICADANSRWLHSQYVEQGIDVLLCPITSKVPAVSKQLKYWPYSKKYGAWIVAANRYGVEGDEDYPGTVFISAPNGRMQAVEDLQNGYISVIVGSSPRNANRP